VLREYSWDYSHSNVPQFAWSLLASRSVEEDFSVIWG
jgi:hypothetical protein